jgi:hypothetical protein
MTVCRCSLLVAAADDASSWKIIGYIRKSWIISNAARGEVRETASYNSTYSAELMALATVGAGLASSVEGTVPLVGDRAYCKFDRIHTF